jgi:hypothetical protein
MEVIAWYHVQVALTSGEEDRVHGMGTRYTLDSVEKRKVGFTVSHCCFWKLYISVRRRDVFW